MVFIRNIFVVSLFFLLPNFQERPVAPDSSRIFAIWEESGLNAWIPFETFNYAMRGYSRIPELGKKNIITIIDYTKPSTVERFYVVDLNISKILYRCLVAHGRNSGENYALKYSNLEGSLESCQGFFLTAETYNGKHGYSLRLDGLEKGINDNARKREIVIHGADYVSTEYINLFARLGRSWGCPALPYGLSREVIDTIAGGSCIFIMTGDQEYLANSGFLK
jgi:hypothetical protein